jgi:hypothetical protein
MDRREVKMHDRRVTAFLVAALAAVMFLAPADARGGARSGQAAHPQASRSAAAASTAPARDVSFDHAITDTGRVLAGMTPDDTARFAELMKRPAWVSHRGEFEANWTKTSTERWPAMRAWRDKEFKAVADACGTLFYPFAGPDFLNAYLLFPSCKQYLLFGLEPVGSIPALEKLAPARGDAALAQMRESLSDLFLRDYFITKTMMSELHTADVDGTVPLMLAMLARLDARVVSVKFEEAIPSPKPAAPAAGAKPASVRAPKPTLVTIVFTAHGATHPQTLVYYQVNLQDPAFSSKPAFIGSLKAQAPFTTFVKSASYLMHDDRFATVRSMVLDDSVAILQDDTGVPFHFFDKTKWALTLYGKYTKPIADFNYGFQKDLDAAFKVPGTARDLPFTFGYHWRVGASSVMLAVRPTATH